jgi:F-type H+-transporting ATPase subunit b
LKLPIFGNFRPTFANPLGSSVYIRVSILRHSMKACKIVGALLVLTGLVIWNAVPALALHPNHGEEGEHEHAGEVAGEAGAAGSEKHGGEAAGHAEHGGSPNPLEIGPDLAVFTLVVFLLLLAILGKFAWGPIATALDHREHRISDNIAQAERLQAEAKAQLVIYEQKLATAADEVRQLLEEARRDAEHTKEEILAQAKADAKAEHDRAMREVRNAKDAALKEIGETSANFAVEMAAKIVQTQLTPEDHARLVREAVASFPSSN